MTTPWVVAFVLLWAIVLLLSLFLIGFFRRVSNVLEQAEARLSAASTGAVGSGLGPDSIVGDFEAVDAAGRQVHGHASLKGRRIYVFLSVDCEPCHTLVDDIRKRGLHSDTAGIVVVLDDAPEARSLELPEALFVIYQQDQSVARAFETMTTPHAFAVDESGVVVDVAVPNTADQLDRLARSLDESSSTRAVDKVTASGKALSH